MSEPKFTKGPLVVELIYDGARTVAEMRSIDKLVCVNVPRMNVDGDAEMTCPKVGHALDPCFTLGHVPVFGASWCWRCGRTIPRPTYTEAR